jgi:hypothetical protein
MAKLEVKVLQTSVSAIARFSMGHEQRYLGVLSRHGKQVGIHLNVTAWVRVRVCPTPPSCNGGGACHNGSA